MLDEYLKRWRLEQDGDPIVTPSSKLLPVRRDGVPAILKVALESEEKLGGLLMGWWDGQGAARVLAHHGDAVLLERAIGRSSLTDLVRGGRDDEASRILCTAVARLHLPRAKPLPELTPLARWFRQLEPAARTYGGVLRHSAASARQLLSAPQDTVVLHGDIHHGNILDFGRRGWLAIDPKGLIGERGFDYANIFCNPDAETATDPDRFEQRLEVIGKTAQLERKRLLQWVLAWAGLAAVWLLGDRQRAKKELMIAAMASAALKLEPNSIDSSSPS